MSKLSVLLATAAVVFASVGLAQTEGDADLQAMEARLATLRMRFTDKHPDVISLLRRIEEHKATHDPGSPAVRDTQSQSKLQAARIRLAELRRQHPSNHPDVQTQVELVEQLEKEEGDLLGDFRTS